MRKKQKNRAGLRWLVNGLAVLAALASGVATCQGAHGATYLAEHAESTFAPAPAKVLAQPQRRLPQSLLPAQVVLDRIEAARLSVEMKTEPPAFGVPLKIGFGRDVPKLQSTPQTSALMVWTAIPGGQIAAVSITSPDALGLRMGLLVEKLPAAAMLRFYAQGSDKVFEVPGQEIMENIARNLTAGDNSDEARTYWSPVIDGQEITLEIELPAGVSPDEVVFSIPRVSHLFSSPLNTRALQEKIGQSSSCHLDSMCSPTWGNQSLATAKMTFTMSGSSYTCTGTLMNDLNATYTPYFLSAKDRKSVV